jgi:cytochrome d ubiquinol oxidase subunit II
VTEAVLLGGIAIVALIVYALTAGADFGGGVWTMLATGSRARAQREVIARAVAPIWEANHVWLIFVIVVLFVCFPSVYATVGTALHLPLAAMLIGIVLRGAAFAFRSHDYGTAQRRWDVLFAVSSVFTPVMLGLCVGAIASGAIRVVDGRFQGDFFSTWAAPFPLAVGGFALVEFAFLGATYLVLETPDPKLRDDFRVRALIAGGISAAMAAIVLVAARGGAPWLFDRLWAHPVAFVAGGLAGSGSVAAQFARWPQTARALAVINVALVVFGWAFAQFPYLIVPDLTVQSASASPAVLRMVLVVLALGGAALVPSFIWLYQVFKGVTLR